MQLLITLAVWLVTIAIVARWRFQERRARRAAVLRGLVAGLAVGLPVAPLSPEGAIRNAALSLLVLPALAAVWVGLSPRAIARCIGGLARRCPAALAGWLLAALATGSGWIPFAVFGAGILGAVRDLDLVKAAAGVRLVEAGISGPQVAVLGSLGVALGLSAQLFLMAYLARLAIRLFLRGEGAEALPTASPLRRGWLIAYGCVLAVFFAGVVSTMVTGQFQWN